MSRANKMNIHEIIGLTLFNLFDREKQILYVLSK